MKIIFLDVDGVLNSVQYYTDHEDDMEENPIDPECVRRVHEIVAATDARIVLTSSWRTEWSREAGQMGELCRKMVDLMAEYHMEIYDKTGRDKNGERGQEIKDWLQQAPEKVESFVILDDSDFWWKKHGLDDRWVRTDFCDGGLKDGDVPKAIDILSRPLARKKRWWRRLI